MIPPKITNQPAPVFRPARERFHSVRDWLESWHSFSFADHHDPDWMGFGPLLVINDDTISAGRGFGMHSHRDMEIITVMIEGELQHQDSAGNSGVIQAGDVQRMSAGTGIMHSEINKSEQTCRLLQIWIAPSHQGLEPAYEQRRIAITDQTGSQCWIQTTAKPWPLRVRFNSGVTACPRRKHSTARTRLSTGWIQMINGKISISGETEASQSDLCRGDGLGFHPSHAGMRHIHSSSDQTDLLLFGLS